MENNPFSTAPGSHGGFRGLSRQIAGFMAGSKLLGGGSGVNAREASQLSNQQHTQNIQRDVVGHVLGTSATEQAAKAAHRRTTAQTKQSHKNKLEQIGAQGNEDRTSSTHYIDHFERLGSSNQFNNLNVNKSGISGTFRDPTPATPPVTPVTPVTPPVNLD